MNCMPSDSNGVHAASEMQLAQSEHASSHTASKLQSCSSQDRTAQDKPSCKVALDSSKESADTSSRSEYYRLMYACLQEKFDYVQASTDRLRDRLYHVKKEVTYLKRMKRVFDSSASTLWRKERRERERERKEAIRAAKRAQAGLREESSTSSHAFLHSSGIVGTEQSSSQVC
ncbi:hypothetical protein COOONC_00467 [Cooperia oncophora]